MMNKPIATRKFAISVRLQMIVLSRLLTMIGLIFATGTPLCAQTLPSGCKTLTLSWGPFDYRPERYIPENTYRSHAALLEIVEIEHFTPEVEAGTRGKKVRHPGKDLAYTLTIFPNHHRALIALSNLAIRLKTPEPIETNYPVDCYFQRAMVFRPDDGLVKLIYANYLIQINRIAEANALIDQVAALQPEVAITQRNIALLYIDAKEPKKALVHAHIALELGLNIDALKGKLQQLNSWQEPVNAEAPVSAASTPGGTPPQ
jgi:tetratricopeptide (TPR) repeat protein